MKQLSDSFVGLSMITLQQIARRSMPLARRIEILGVFGAGKTTLAHALSEGRHLLLENHKLNPYWGSTAPTRVGHLGYELSFLVQHHFLASSAPSSVSVADWSLLTDRLWASLRLTTDEFAAYDATHRLLAAQIGNPIAYLYLRLPPEVVLGRSQARGRIEESFHLAELKNASDALQEAVASISSAPVVILETDTPLEVVQSRIQTIERMFAK